MLFLHEPPVSIRLAGMACPDEKDHLDENQSIQALTDGATVGIDDRYGRPGA
ncbi:hypothetical protein GCM10007392_28190 [Saccharospirillum salsuginis]|uniref:Uncharacterized protein n=1 Tax=Saccharospirillum salsuginis TaxID=418750 RepID=A0A918KCE4_9GAMM|nr:hypothetical protein GCM10007392_28190 [Saccharospirillum salsuginis]